MTEGASLTLLAYAVGMVVFAWEARRRSRVPGMATVLLAGLLGGVVGAKLAEWLLGGGPLFWRHPLAILDPRMGGRTLIGGVLGGWLAVELAKRRLGIRRSTGDCFALALPAGEAVGRLGCFLNGCCYGVPANMPWAVWQHGAWRHPTQLYASLEALIILGILLALRANLPREGDLFKWYLFLYGWGRFGVEFLRERDLFAGGLSLAQWICLGMILIAVPALKRLVACRVGMRVPCS